MMPFIVRVGVGCVQTAAVRRPDLNRVRIDEPVFDRIILAYNPDTSTLIGAIRRATRRRAWFFWALRNGGSELRNGLGQESRRN